MNSEVSRLFRSLDPLDEARAVVNCKTVSLNVSFCNGLMFVWLVVRLSFGDLPLGWLLSLDWVGVSFHPQGDGLGRLGFVLQQIWAALSFGVLFGPFLFGSSCLVAL